jgi:hypothetical protein
MNESPSQSTTRSTQEIIVLLTAAMLLSIFVAIRFGGLWGEHDTYVFARSIQAVLDHASLVPPRFAYSNGYGYPALGAFLVQTTGLTVAQLQIFGGALLAGWVILPAWLAYRELTGSPRGATLATVIILVQPEFLFPVLRGSHEKFTRGLIFLALYLLVRSILARQQWRRFTSFLLAFYLIIYALISFNNLLAISFITAIGLSLLLSLAIRQIAKSRQSGGIEHHETAATRRRLLYTIGTSLILAFFFTFYAYEPARTSIFLIESTTDRMAMLFLEAGEVATNPYGTIASAWISLPVYLIITIANWLLLVFSFILWVSQTVYWWLNRRWPSEPRVILLWSLFGAFGFLGALSIIADVSGAIAANLQHRMFPSFAMIAAPFLADWYAQQRLPEVRTRRLAYGALAVVIAYLGVVAVVKATNEPAVSNKWTYYTPAEFTSLEWSQRFNPDEAIWSAFDERIESAIGICCAWMPETALLDNYALDTGTRTVLISDVTRAQSERLDTPLPIQGDSLRIYDNGAAEIYRLRPRTPFQR